MIYIFLSSGTYMVDVCLVLMWNWHDISKNCKLIHTVLQHSTKPQSFHMSDFFHLFSLCVLARRNKDKRYQSEKCCGVSNVSNSSLNER